jgi:hypothetical protein
MRKEKSIALDFEIDRLTNSIRNVVSGESFQTEVFCLSRADLKQISKKNKWKFDWKSELDNNQREVHKLTTLGNASVVQGLVSLSHEPDHIYMHLLESAPFNVGKHKLYEGVAGNLVAYACKVSFMQGLKGFVGFTAKTKLIEHYKKTLGAIQIGAQRMAIEDHAAKKLVEQYFKDYDWGNL